MEDLFARRRDDLELSTSQMSAVLALAQDALLSWHENGVTHKLSHLLESSMGVPHNINKIINRTRPAIDVYHEIGVKVVEIVDYAGVFFLTCVVVLACMHCVSICLLLHLTRSTKRRG